MSKKVNISISFIDRLELPAPGKRAVYHDAKTPGLQLRVSSTGVKTWAVFSRVKGGSPERITIGRYPSVKPEKARKDAAQIMADLATGKSVSAQATRAKDEMTFGDLFEDFLQHRRNRRGEYLTESTKAGYRKNFSAHLSKLANKKLSKIKDTDVAALHTRIGKTAPYQANRVLALISSMFGHAHGRKLHTGANPAVGIRKFAETSRDRFLQTDELPRFFRAVAEEPNETVRDYVLISLLTGARKGNVLAMRWADLNLERGEWRIKRTKNGDPQTIPLGPEAIEILQARRPGGKAEYVFPGEGRSGHLADPKAGWRRILGRAEAFGIMERLEATGHGEEAATAWTDAPNVAEGLAAVVSLAERHDVPADGLKLNDLRVHDLRRTLGSWQAKTGASLAIIGKSLNHRSTNTTAIYARLDLDPVRESVGRATAAMLEAGGLKERAKVVQLKK